MSEYLVLLKLNPGKVIEALGAIRSLPSTPIPGVNLSYAMNIFGAWDVGIWINAENSNQVLEFTQKKVREMAGVTEVYTVPTFPHGNAVKGFSGQETKTLRAKKTPLQA